MERYNRSNSIENNNNNKRYLPNGKLNITARWNSPGPSYILPSAIGFVNHDLTLTKRPAYSFGLKLTDQHQMPKSPGPIYLPDYKVTNTGKEKSPGYFITSRHKESTLHSTPGPGHYAPEKHGNISKPGVPAFSFSSRHKHLEIPTHPVGPNQYTVPNTIGHVNYVTNIKNSPAFSISSRNNSKSNNNSNTYYSLYYPNLDCIKKTHPKWTIVGRHYLPDCTSQTPGPNQYRADYLKRNVRSATMGIRHSEFCTTGLPAHFIDVES